MTDYKYSWYHSSTTRRLICGCLGEFTSSVSSASSLFSLLCSCSEESVVFPHLPCQLGEGADDVKICSPTFFLCSSISRFGFGGIMERERHSCHCGSLQCIGPGCSSFLTYLEVVCGKQRLHYIEFLHLSFHRSSWLLLAPLLTPPVPLITAPPCSLCPEGAHRFQWIRNLVPEFGISSSHVKVLSSPAEFYELLKVSCGFQVVGMVFGGWELQWLWRIIDKLLGRSTCRLLVQPSTWNRIVNARSGQAGSV